MKKVFVLICLVLTAFHISAQNRRTFIILQDNSGSYYNSSQSDIQHIQNSLKKLFNNEQILDEYSLISSELKQGIPFYELNSSSKCNGIHINNLFKFFVWCEVSKSFTRSII